MNCVVTAGPTYEPLDEVRRLTNSSTGRLGVELADYLAAAGHEVTLLLGALATWTGPCRARRLERFTTVADLRQRLEARRSPDAPSPIDAVFHAAAVSDFRFGRLFERLPSGEQRILTAGKLPTRAGTLLAELVPTAKLIAELRGWFPTAFLAGWKFEVDGDRALVIERCRHQLQESRTDICVANGPAYGPGFGMVNGAGEVLQVPDLAALCATLESTLRRKRRGG